MQCRPEGSPRFQPMESGYGKTPKRAAQDRSIPYGASAPPAGGAKLSRAAAVLVGS